MRTNQCEYIIIINRDVPDSFVRCSNNASVDVSLPVIGDNIVGLCNHHAAELKINFSTFGIPITDNRKNK